MDLMEIRDYCLALPYTEEATPFDETTLVYKVGGKIFALTDIDDDWGINLKCDPDYALQLRERYDEITPGWHMNKKHWNTVDYRSDLPAGLVKSLIEHSYLTVVNKLALKTRHEILAEYEKFRMRNPHPELTAL